MIRIHSSMNAIEVHNLKNVLEGQGIDCEVLGEFRHSVMGEVPLTDAFVELWIVDDAQEAAARDLLSGTGETASPWRCPKCAEAVDGEFDMCWNCQTPRGETSQ